MKTTTEAAGLEMDKIYEVATAQKKLGVGRKAIDKLKREGLNDHIRILAQKEYVLSNDIWEAMTRKNAR